MGWLRSFWDTHRLIGKHAILMGAAFVIGVPAASGLLFAMLKPVFAEVEQKQAADQTARAENALIAYEEGLKKGVGDYALWDDSFDFMAAPDPNFVRETLVPLTYQGMGVDLVAYVRFDGTVVWSKTVDRSKPAYVAGESEHFATLLSKGSFFEQAKAKETHSAYIRSDRGLYLVYSHYQLKSDGSGKPVGFVVMGNLLDAKSVSSALQVNARLDLTIPAASAQQLQSAPGHIVSTTDASAITTHLGLAGQDGHILGQVQFSTPRDVTAAGWAAAKLGALLIALAMIFMQGMISLGIRVISVARLQALEAYVRDFQLDGRRLPDDAMTGRDEIASLAREFQALSDKLAEADSKLRESAYLQGKADSASGMLHNVRNALAPVRVMQDKWLREETLPYRINMKRAVEELDNPSLDSARKADLEQFLITAARKLVLVSDARIGEMEETKESISQIATILGSYNFDTTARGAGEDIDLMAVLRQEIKIVDAREEGPVQWTVPESLPAIVGNRVHLGQVVGNILVNAHEAMVAAGVADKRVALAATTDPAAGTLTLTITDNGDGIADEDIAKAFHRGFSTRSHKSGGIGMHWSANAMRAMGGSIALESRGKGQGATAILTLRLAEAEAERIAA